MLLLLLLALLIGPAEHRLTGEERAIVAAVLEFTHKTAIAQAAAPTAFTSGTAPVGLALDEAKGYVRGKSEVLAIPNELIVAIRKSNAQQVRLTGIPQPKTHSGKPQTISRPGISADGSKAIMVIGDDEHGGIPYLEKRDGKWQVVALLGQWEF